MKFLIAAGLLWLAGCSSNAAKIDSATETAPAPLEVRVAQAEARNVPKIVSVNGSLLPDESVNLAFEVPGKVERILVDFGQPVRRGQVVAELDSRELNLQVERSRAALSQALARIGVSPGAEQATVESTPAIRQATAQLEDARSKYESAAKLVESGDISRERHVELEKSLRAREAAVQASRDELRTQLASVEGLRVELNLSQKRLGDAILRAPFDGAVSAKLVSPGQYLKENTPVLTVVKTHPLRLRAAVPEPAVSFVKVGASLTFTTDAAPNTTFNAVLREINPALDSTSRAMIMEARPTVNDPRLKPGMFVQVDLVVDRNASVVAVPREAVHTVAGLSKVFVIRGGQAAERRIQPGRQIGDWVEIPSGVQAGERVAVSRLPELVNGAKVAGRS